MEGEHGFLPPDSSSKSSSAIEQGDPLSQGLCAWPVADDGSGSRRALWQQQCVGGSLFIEHAATSAAGSMLMAQAGKPCRAGRALLPQVTAKEAPL